MLTVGKACVPRLVLLLHCIRNTYLSAYRWLPF